MTSPELSEIFTAYQRFVPVMEYLQQQSTKRFRRGIYTLPVVLWLMILQRLHPKGTLSQAVHGCGRVSRQIG